MMDELIDAFDRADADDGVRAIIVTGAGRGFCAGADLSAGRATFDRRRPDRKPIPTGADGKPDLSHDNARDGGGRVALRIFEPEEADHRRHQRPRRRRRRHHDAADGRAHRVGARHASASCSRAAASCPRPARSWFLPRVVGISQALEWAYPGACSRPSEALAGGLVSRVVPPSELSTRRARIAREIADGTAPCRSR